LNKKDVTEENTKQSVDEGGLGKTAKPKPEVIKPNKILIFSKDN
jgi:hypothetical protein